LLVFFVCVPAAWAGGPFMMVGAAEDVGKQQDYAFAKTSMDKAKLAGFDSIRLTQTWTKGQQKLGPFDQITLGNAITAAQFTGIRVVLSLYPFGSSVTPLTDQDRADFASFAADIAKRYPLVRAQPQPVLAAAVRDQTARTSPRLRTSSCSRRPTTR